MGAECLITRLPGALRTRLGGLLVSSHPQVITPVRTSHGYVYEYPTRYQKDVYDVPPFQTAHGVRTKNVVVTGERGTSGSSASGLQRKGKFTKICTFHVKLYLSCLSRGQYYLFSGFAFLKNPRLGSHEAFVAYPFLRECKV